MPVIGGSAGDGTLFPPQTGLDGFVLSTAGGSPKWVPAGFVPTICEGANLIAYGHSYVAGAGANNSYGYVNRLARRLGVSTFSNNGVSGYTSSNTIAQKITSSFVGLPVGVFVLVDFIVNDAQDAGTGGSLAKGVAKYSNALATACYWFRATGHTIPSSGNVAYSGFAQDNADYGQLALQPYSATASGSTVTITSMSAGDKVAVLLGGVDDATALTPGGAYSISVSSSNSGPTVVATGTTSNQFLKGRDGNSIGYMPVVVTLPATGTGQTITITKTDGSGTKLNFVGALFGLRAPGTGVVQVHMKQPPTPNLDSVGNLSSFTAAQASVLSAVGGIGQDIVIVDPTLYGWDKTKHVSTDNNHPNDAGHNIITNAACAELAKLTSAYSRTPSV